MGRLFAIEIIYRGIFQKTMAGRLSRAIVLAAHHEGKVGISERLVQFAGLRQDVVLVGIDEHFELWDAASWRTYTQKKSAEARSAMAEHE